MMTQNRLNAVLARQKKGLVVDALIMVALIVALGIAATALWLRLPSLAPAYGHENPAMGSSTPASLTATMLEQSEDEACRVVEPSC